MSDRRRCPRCGSSVELAEPCAACALTVAVAGPPAPRLEGERLGPYTLQRLLGQGGMGVVYEAVDTRPTSPRFGVTVALKILAAEIDTPAQLVREAQLAASLEHQHIVPVYEVGEHEGIDYFTMKHIDGGRLAVPARDARSAAATALAIARAVAFAHRHGVLHLDLKPANVLVDKEGRPFVTDFGIATREEPASRAALAPGGTPAYMAPEVWRGEPGAASTAADVWGVGAILYEMLRGHAPFAVEPCSWEDLQRRVTMESPPPLAGVPVDLAAVCLHCLEKDPARRYATADALAVDLERFLAGDSVAARPLGLGARGLRRARRHPVFAALAALLFVAALHATVTEISLARAQRAALRAAEAELSLARAQRSALRVAEFAAHSAADLVAREFDRYRAVVEAAGQDPRVARAALDPTSPQASEACARLLTERILKEPFATWFLLDTGGKEILRAPAGTYPTLGRSYAFRDYFRGAEEHERQGRRAAYVSRAFLSESDHDYEIAISFPIHDDEGRWVGLLGATFPTGFMLGSLDLGDPGDEGLTAALLAPRGPERDGMPDDAEPIFLLHRALRRGEKLPAHPDDMLSMGLGSGAFMRVVPVRDTPFSVLVRVLETAPAPRP